ncbi:LacI family DNA-binding transcriptional regulator [Halothermothrix orenii]|uniref:Transcriptional regulator, LacI family n=1 Tax=Halothermothrix orenii (strain H 168 / OCM 544 / DSM 9562) TaxID=373903 RepID=B8CYD8_HALOH|nr:LacI family DNA-binding transcriptional regulator [Halothermothrix orenii]ACL70307.1 transcriptional regulator, LacI family [Halothermothrix orenii H 168]
MGLTIKDIAQKAGVSTATVSRVLNNSKPVSPQLKKKVLKVVEETGYRPNALARGLIKKHTALIGVIIPDVANLNFAEMIKGIEQVADENNFDIILSSSGANVDKELEIFDVFIEKQLDGIIFSGVFFTDRHKEFFNKYNIPTVIVGQNFPGVELPSVTINNFQAAYEATSYLIELGHRRIGMITGPLKDIAAGLDRYRGFSAALKEYKVKEIEEYVVEGDFNIDSGYRCMEDILTGKEVPPTAIFAASDKIAIGAMNCCYDKGYKVPDDISIIGFDDTEVASVVRPSLTTIHQNHQEIGSTTAQLLIDRIKGRHNRAINVQLPYRLIERESTRKIR